MKVEDRIIAVVSDAVAEIAGKRPDPATIGIQKTRKDVEGDLTLVVFPLVRLMKKSPEDAAELLGKRLVAELSEVAACNVVKGFLNIVLTDSHWTEFIGCNRDNARYGLAGADGGEGNGHPVVVEFSSPNTNKPLHLGHIRNNLLGYSVSLLLQAAGKNVVKVNLVNDRGIHICKSMLAWLRYGDGETPEMARKKGDKLVGDYYVQFETELRSQMQTLMEEKGFDEDTARSEAPLMEEARDLLRRWENRDPEVVAVWEKMNGWVYEGFDQTYQRLGVDFDRIYYESGTYLLGREIVLEGLRKGVLYRKEDGSVWAGLKEFGLDDKLLLRADGTSVYMTQDIGTAQLRYDDYCPGRMIYVVGNEQNHHFSVLKKVLEKLGKPYADALFHLSYGMVELPDGRMKSREGTVVDADDLMDEMVDTARATTEELGKTRDFSEEEKRQLYADVGLGALKYFILKVDPKKNMVFHPEESIDFFGNTASFIQYTHARICSVLRKAGEKRMESLAGCPAPVRLNPRERQLIRTLYDFPSIVREAADELSPARVANYAYELAREFNQFYHDCSILNEEDRSISDFRLCLAKLTAQVIRNGLSLLGIAAPERM